jgi:RecA-family ATPase/DNA-binding transcriptional regulator YiaG
MQNKKEQRVSDDIERVWSKEMSEDVQQSSDNPFMHPYSLESFGTDEVGGEPIIEKILNRQEILQIFAPSGVGKSIYVDNIIASLLSGESLFNEFKVVKSHDVYLIDAEMSPRERGDRLRSIAQKSGSRFYAMSLLESGYKLNNSQHFAHFAEAMRHFKPAVIVIDPWKAAHSANENEASEIEPIIDNIRRLMFEINASVIIVHHAGRDFVTRTGERVARHSRGSSVLDDRSDIIWEVEETSDADVTTLRRHKLRGFRKEMANEYKIHYDRVTGICVSISKRGEHADFIRRKRLEMKLTQEEFAQMFKVTARAVRYWEAGVFNPSDKVIKRLQ